MSRSRSGSVLNERNAPLLNSAHIQPHNETRLKDPLSVTMLQMARPRLEFDQQSDEPTYPSLLSTKLLLPKPDQKVYVGEDFCGVIIIEKQLPIDDDKASVRIDVQTPDSLRSELTTFECDFGKVREKTEKAAQRETGDIINDADEKDPENNHFSQLNPERTDYMARLKLTRSGTWNLCVSMRYSTEMIKQSLWRVFPIEARRAIQVRTKISQSPHTAHTHVLEAQIENITETVMVIESCALIAENQWKSSALFGAETPHLKPKEVYQFCFTMTRGTAPEAGRLTVGWRREPMGIKGWQITGAIRV